MRRFSQRNALVTLSEINITPLLDLAFVLLIIFVITTPLLEQSIHLKLPGGGAREVTVNSRNIRTVEVSPQGGYFLNAQRMTLEQLLQRLQADHRVNPNLVVRIRVDEMGLNKHTVAVIDGCQKRGLSQFSLATDPRR
jgi:biopolymer transport protein ExbD